MTTLGMIGLPEAGKTTYAVVFFQACDAGLDELAITKYGVGNRAYLNDQADQLAHCIPLERTSQQKRNELRLQVKLSPDSPERELLMPDHSGEFLRDSMSARVLDKRLVDLNDQSDALMLFVRSNALIEAHALHDFNKLLREAGEEPGGSVAPDRPEDWDVKLAATQARLTDVIQELVDLRGGRPVRIPLILSAWDKQAEEDLSPEAWADLHLPLLVQALRNDPSIEWEVFGVSAQGGDFSGPEVSELKKLRVEERPKVELADGTATGIGAPLRWALEPQ